MVDSKLNGTVRQLDNGHFVLTFNRMLHIPINGAWNTLVSRKERDSWFQGVSFVDKVEGIIRFDFGDEGLVTGRIVSVNKPSELVYTLVWKDMPVSEVSWSFTRIDDSNTMLVLAHQNLTSGSLVDWAVGWHIILDDLVAYVEHKKMPFPDFEELGEYYTKQLVL